MTAITRTCADCPTLLARPYARYCDAHRWRRFIRGPACGIGALLVVLVSVGVCSGAAGAWSAIDAPRPLSALDGRSDSVPSSPQLREGEVGAEIGSGLWLRRRDQFALRFEVAGTGCWLWTGAITQYGYGRLGAWPRDVFAHRLSYEIHRGPIPDDLFVLHNCDVRRCVNPEHLRVGTPQDNSNDAVTRGRIARGVDVASAKLTPEIVAEIRGLYQRGRRGFGQPALAARFGVAKSTVYAIVTGANWRRSDRYALAQLMAEDAEDKAA